jgi:hypothetical protein
LFGFGLFGFYQRGANGSGEFFDYVFGIGDELCALFDELIWREADGLRYVSGCRKLLFRTPWLDALLSESLCSERLR